MKVIRASELGTYQFCNRAWWYQLQGYKSDHQVELSRGAELHTRHFYRLTATGCLQAVAYSLVLFAIILFVLYMIQLG